MKNNTNLSFLTLSLSAQVPLILSFGNTLSIRCCDYIGDAHTEASKTAHYGVSSFLCSSRRQRVATSSDFLVDNPIYKTSTSSLISSAENGLQSRNRTLRTVASEGKLDASPTHSSCKLSADNPQYGTNLAPPPNEKPPRYIKVSTGAEPMYELIQGSDSGMDKVSVRASVHSAASGDGGGGEGDPVYSTPARPPKRDSAVPLYESTMDIPAMVGADGEYAKLNHNK